MKVIFLFNKRYKSPLFTRYPRRPRHSPDEIWFRRCSWNMFQMKRSALKKKIALRILSKTPEEAADPVRLFPYPKEKRRKEEESEEKEEEAEQ